MERAKQDWIGASEFHPLDNGQVLDQVLRRIERERKDGNQPVLLLDLDSTLYEVGPRTLSIVREWRDSAVSAPFPQVRQLLAQVSMDHIEYSLRDLFQRLGVTERSEQFAELKEALPLLRKFWEERFFSNDYLSHDLTYSGASRFVHQAHQAGAHIIYLTGRDEPQMGPGTRKRLVEDGFPFEIERTDLFLKQHRSIDDTVHKIEVAVQVETHGKLVASFENEPKNLVALAERFPDAMHVFVDTVFSDNPAPVRKGLYRIRGFELS